MSLFKIGAVDVTADGYSLEYVTPAYDENNIKETQEAVNDCLLAGSYHNVPSRFKTLSVIEN